MDKNLFWTKVRKVVINKYFITVTLFAIILIFIGDHSLIQYAKRARKIRSIERQIEVTNKQILEAESDLRTLQNPDSLERFAREKYLMHTKNEDVYLVD